MRSWKANLLCVLIFSIGPARCQTIGNGTIIAPAAGTQGPYGINSVPDIGGGPSAFLTRHHKRGSSSGIGGSFIETTSPTSESSPAQAPVSFAPLNTVQFRLPRLSSTPSETINSPALRSYTPALPSFPESSALNNPMTTPSFARDYSSTSLEDLPSFSRQPSLIDKLQFDQFGK